MMFNSFSAILFVLGIVTTTAKTPEEWKALGQKNIEQCAEELNLKDDMVTNMTLLQNVSKLEELNPNQRCFIKCYFEKTVGEEMTNPEAFRKATEEHFEKISKDLKNTNNKKNAFKETYNACKDMKGDNECDSAAMEFLCEKEYFKKVCNNFVGCVKFMLLICAVLFFQFDFSTEDDDKSE